MKNNSLINNSKNENIFKRFSDDNIINESIASKYADYLDEFSYNISNKNNDSESLIQNEMINESEMNNLFNDDFISKNDLSKNDSFFKLDQDSVLKDVQMNISQILKKNKNLSNSSFTKNIFQEKDFSFNSKNFLSFLEEEDNEEKSLLDEIEESLNEEGSLDEKKKLFFKNFLVLKKKKKNKKKFINNFSLFYKLEHISKDKFRKNYYIFENGTYNSKKNTKNKNIFIGRLEKLKKYFPNDIIIPNKTISRLHCQLINKNYFKKKSLLKKKYLYMINFLKKKNINNSIIYIIFKYLIPKKGIYLQDLNSITGTYLKLRQKFQIKEGDNFLLGAEANFNVIFIKNTKNILFKIRKKIKIDLKNTVFFGFESKDINKNILLRENFILLETNNCSSNLKKYIIIKALKDKEYLMGRREVIDIKINLQDISRVHCKIYYKDNNWFFIDGYNGKTSINGTWINLKNRIYKKKFSKKILLKNGDTFKISDDIFVFHNKF